MIRGSKKRFDDRFGVPMELFLGSLRSASLTYKGTDTLFNTFSSPSRYENYLQDRYDSAKDSVEIIVTETLNKTHKLELIGDIITEVKASITLLSIDRDGKIIHKNFPGRRILKEVTNESDYQEFYYYMKYFLKKMLTFLKELKETVSLTSQNDFVVLPPMMPDKISVTNDNLGGNFFKIMAGASKKAKAVSLFNTLVKEGYMTESSKADFVNAFIGNPPKNKIDWIGNFGDLKTLINSSINKGLIENTKFKWVIAANIFTSEGIDFNRKAIKDTRNTKNKAEIERIVNSTI